MSTESDTLNIIKLQEMRIVELESECKALRKKLDEVYGERNLCVSSCEMLSSELALVKKQLDHAAANYKK
jgi:hypothetical protein